MGSIIQAQPDRSEYTSLPATIEGQRRKAESYLNLFSRYTSYLHGDANPYTRWLPSNLRLSRQPIEDFMGVWYPVSRRQPQILYKIMGSLSDWDARHLIIPNVMEEDGHVKAGDQPHYELLEELIVKLGCSLNINPEAQRLVDGFHRSLDGISEAEAIGALAAIEFPALDISGWFGRIISLSGHPEFLTEDPYVYIHIRVEPEHVILSHGAALDWMTDEDKQKRLNYRKEDVISAFTRGMEFWENLWCLGFAKLGYPSALGADSGAQ